MKKYCSSSISLLWLLIVSVDKNPGTSALEEAAANCQTGDIVSGVLVYRVSLA